MWKKHRKITLCLLFWAINLSCWGQKKVPDTIYVYEEVVVYDTIFVSKPTEELLKKARIIVDPIAKSATLTFPGVALKNEISILVEFPTWFEPHSQKNASKKVSINPKNGISTAIF
ncbi:MAG: hypothetical protein CFE24_01270 [Flavobacterium sp. BFFFF2]|nr:MAG: hypothetical protein CFE24_01270 [Flavobacterium sp. BFFFF2]